MTMVDSPLQRMAATTPTAYWNDSCAVDELTYAVERGAVGATSNPSIVLDVLKKERAHWLPRVRELARAHPTWTEVEITWALVEEMAARGAAILRPVFDREHGLMGRLSVQTNPANYPDPARMVEQAVRFHGLAPTSRSSSGHGGRPHRDRGGDGPGRQHQRDRLFTVPQVIAVAEAVERGLDRRAAAAPTSPRCRRSPR